MLWKIGASLPRAKSLVSLHLSDNQGITPNLIEKLSKRVKCRELHFEKRVDLDAGMDGAIDKGNQIGFYLNSDKYLRENMIVRANKKKSISHKIPYLKEEKRLIFERNPGHKSDIPGSG